VEFDVPKSTPHAMAMSTLTTIKGRYVSRIGRKKLCSGKFKAHQRSASALNLNQNKLGT